MDTKELVELAYNLEDELAEQGITVDGMTACDPPNGPTIYLDKHQQYYVSEAELREWKNMIVNILPNAEVTYQVTAIGTKDTVMVVTFVVKV